MTPENCPFTVTIHNYPGPRGRVVVDVPDGNAPLIHPRDECEACQEGTGEHVADERDYGSAVWPSDERIAAEASKQAGHLVRFVGDGDACENGGWVVSIEPVACLGHAFGVDGDLQELLDGLTVRDSDGREVESYAACLLAVEADLAGTDRGGLRVEWSTGPRPWSRERVARYLDGLDPEERRELREAALRPPCQAPATEHVEIESVAIALCAAHAAEARAAE